jgi:hypothetical protein
MRAIASCNTTPCTNGQQTKERAVNQLLEVGIMYHYFHFLVNYVFLSLKLLFMVIKERGKGMMEKRVYVCDPRGMKDYLVQQSFRNILLSCLLKTGEYFSYLM